MIAFVSFVKAFSIWIYIFSALGILFGVKMLFDARRLSRTTMFSLDQERAVETTSRGLLLIVVMAALIFAVTIVTVVVAPFVPQSEPPIARGVTPTIANIFPTAAPTLTPTTIITRSTETPFFTGTPPPLPVWTFTFTPSPTKATSGITTTVVSTPISNLLPAPKLVYDKSKGDAVFDGVSCNNENSMNTCLVFKWNWVCPQCVLGPTDRYVVIVTFTDRQTGALRTIAGGTLDNQITLGKIIGGYGDSGQFYQKAKDNQYQWYVQVKRGTTDQPISAPSETWKFTWN